MGMHAHQVMDKFDIRRLEYGLEPLKCTGIVQSFRAKLPCIRLERFVLSVEVMYFQDQYLRAGVIYDDRTLIQLSLIFERHISLRLSRSRIRLYTSISLHVRVCKWIVA